MDVRTGFCEGTDTCDCMCHTTHIHIRTGTYRSVAIFAQNLVALFAAFVAPAHPMPVHKVSLTPSEDELDTSSSSPPPAAQPTFSAQPANRTELTVGFYNVSTKKKWEHIEVLLIQDVHIAVAVHKLDILCLSGLPAPKDSFHAEDRIRQVMTWARLRMSGDGQSPGPPLFRVCAAGQYATIVMDNSFAVLDKGLVSALVQEEPGRCFQHLRLRMPKDNQPVSIINYLAPAMELPSAYQHKQTLNACNTACEGERFIWGGFFNLDDNQLVNLMKDVDERYTFDSSAAQPGTLQLAFAHPRNYMRGDLAMIHGMRCEHTDSQVGQYRQGASDSHDLVAVKVIDFGGSSSCEFLPAIPSNVALTPATPILDGMLNSDPSAEETLRGVIDKIQKYFSYGKVANIVVGGEGCYEASGPPHIAEKLEGFLRIVNEQRANHISRTPGLNPQAIFSENDMKSIHHAWIDDHRTWMNTETFQKYERFRKGTKGAHKLRQKAFNAYRFQVIGDKNILMDCIKHPICSAAQPAEELRRMFDAWTPSQQANAAWDLRHGGPPASGSQDRRARSRSRTHKE